MPIISAPYEPLESATFVDLQPIFGRALVLKCEGFNFAGSIKIRTAAALIAAAERDGQLTDDSVLIESSSGNLGLAVAAIAASKGIPFVCVTDPKCNRTTFSLMRAMGARIVVVADADVNGGYLEARLRYVRESCAADPRFVWLNQYGNPAGWNAHYDTTAPEIAKEFPDLDVLFVGAGTGGTLMGCARYFRDQGAAVRVIAVDAYGSVAFGGPPGLRMIPGLGTSVQPELLDVSVVDDVVHVAETDAIRSCRVMSRRGFLFGGSTGSVVSGALRWLAEHDPGGALRSLALSPDLADRYSHTIYDDEWVDKNFGTDVLEPLHRLPFRHDVPASLQGLDS